MNYVTKEYREAIRTKLKRDVDELYNNHKHPGWGPDGNGSPLTTKLVSHLYELVDFVCHFDESIHNYPEFSMVPDGTVMVDWYYSDEYEKRNLYMCVDEQNIYMAYKDNEYPEGRMVADGIKIANPDFELIMLTYLHKMFL